MRDIAEIILRSFAVFLLLGSILSFVVGLGLLLRQRAMMNAFGLVNRWVSTRRAMKPFEMPRAADAGLLQGRRRWVSGALFFSFGAYAAFALAANVDPARVVVALGARGSLLAGIVIEAMRWILIVGCTGAAIAGLVLLLSPAAWGRVEAWANRWVSTRRAMAGGDAMVVTLDQWVATFPRAAGVLMAGLAFIPAVAALLLFTARI
jgi:hypothetical protein